MDTMDTLVEGISLEIWARKLINVAKSYSFCGNIEIILRNEESVDNYNSAESNPTIKAYESVIEKVIDWGWNAYLEVH